MGINQKLTKQPDGSDKSGTDVSINAQMMFKLSSLRFRPIALDYTRVRCEKDHQIWSKWEKKRIEKMHLLTKLNRHHVNIDSHKKKQIMEFSSMFSASK